MRAYKAKKTRTAEVMRKHDVRRHASYRLEKYVYGQLVHSYTFTDFYDLRKEYKMDANNINVAMKVYLDEKEITFLDARYMLETTKDFLQLLADTHEK